MARKPPITAPSLKPTKQDGSHAPFKQGGTVYIWDATRKGYYPTNTPNAGAEAHDAQARAGLIPTVPYAPMYQNGKNTPQGAPPGTRVINPAAPKPPVKKATPTPVTVPVTTQAQINARTRASSFDTTNPSKSVGNTKVEQPKGAGSLDALLGLDGGSVGQMIDPSLASSIAGGTYDPVINDLNNQLGMLPGQTKQNKADITNWMNQVISSLARSNTRADNNYDAAAGSAGSTAKGIIASLGGSDNPAGGMIGASGANAAAMMQALKGNQDAFAGDMTPILNLEKSSQLNNQQATSDTLSRDLMSQLASAQGQKSGLDAQTQMQITQMNNALAQQRFGNIFGVDQANLAAQVASGQTNLTNLYKQAQINKINASLKNHSAPKGSYGATTPSDRARIASQINSAVQALKSSNPNIGAQPVIQMINGMLNTTGWNMNDPGVSSWRNGVFTTVGINPTTQSWTAG